ncbi:Haloacid dehalogenase-like hydrolase (HAD) superfamily protein [Euphorbia peplus]|nr:Haloacid dehalogenase-like hydrolase (HAD) superfamily protein [Euphorbia peplus]
MATLNVVKILCEDDNDNKKRHSHLDNGNADVVVACPPDSQCDLEPILSKRKKKKWIKMQRQITNLVTDNDAPINIRVDTKTGTGRDSIARRKKKKLMRMQRQITNLVTENDAPINIRVDTKLGTDDSVGNNSCRDSLVQINAKTDSDVAAEPTLTCQGQRKVLCLLRNKVNVNLPGREESALPFEKQSESPREPVLISSKRKRKKKKLNASGITNEVNVSLADVNLPGTEKSALPSEKQSESPREPALISSKRKRKKKKLNASGITNEVNVSLADVNLPGREESALPFEKQSESPREPVLISSKRKRKKKKLNASGITNEVNVSLADVNLPGTEKSALPSEKQSESPREPALISSKRKRKKKKLNASGITNEVNVSLADVNLPGREESALPFEKQSESPREPVLISSKRKRKKKKLNASGITNEVNVSLADVNLPGTEKSALPSEKQSESPREPALISSKRKRKKKKLNASGITNEVNVSLADVNLPGREESALPFEKQNVNLPGTEKSALPSEKQSESPRSSIVNMHNDLDVVGMERNGLPSETQSDTTILSVDVVEKHDNNGDAALISDRIANIRQKSKRRRDKKKLNKAHVPPVELDRSGEENALVRGKESNSCSTSSSNQGSACILVEKENTKTNHIEGKLRRSKKKSKSSNPERNMQPTTVAAEVAAEVNVLGNLLAEKTSSNCLIESMDIINIKKSTDLSFSVEKHKFQQVACPRVGAPVGYSGKKLLILDLNGLLADIVIHSERERKADIVISKKAVFRRPFCHDFLQFCFEKFNVGIWSSRIRKNVDMVVNFLMADSRHKLLFCWDQSHCTNTGFKTLENRGKPLVLKELKKLWDKLVDGLPWNKGDYNESNTLLLDDSPYKALRNPANTAIFPYPYVHSDTGDSSLGPGGDLRVYLEKLAEAQNVQEFIAHNPFGQPAITESSGKWSFYKKIVR